MVPPVTMVSDPGNVPAATPTGTTMGNGDLSPRPMRGGAVPRAQNAEGTE